MIKENLEIDINIDDYFGSHIRTYEGGRRGKGYY
jgi:hypothetical protein